MDKELMNNLGSVKKMLGVLNKSPLMGVIPPQMGQAMEYVKKNGGDPKKAFYALAEEKGLDPEEILSYIR